jgi:Ca2+-binding RTX toxin-like protein
MLATVVALYNSAGLTSPALLIEEVASMRRILLLLTVVALMVLAGGVAWAANIQCPNAGIYLGVWRLCNGTEKADTMQGTKYPDRMKGKSGADTMYGWGNGSYDSLYGGPGPDKMYGGQGGDYLFAGAGVDRLYGQGEPDRLLTSNAPRDQGRQDDLTDDYIYGGAEDDEFLVGGLNGVDRVYGGTGDDEFWVAGNAATGAKEIVECGPGTDAVHFDEGVDVVNDTCEALYPS